MVAIAPIEQFLEYLTENIEISTASFNSFLISNSGKKILIDLPGSNITSEITFSGASSLRAAPLS